MPVEGTFSARSLRNRLDLANSSRATFADQEHRSRYRAGQLLEARNLFAGKVATTSLPHSSKGMAWSRQKRFIEAAPATQLRALSEPVL